MRIYIATFGCKVNQYESDAIAANCTAHGLELVDSWQIADAIILNSCVVTNRAEQKSASMLRRIIRENPNAKIILTGCMTEKTHTDYGQIDVRNKDKVEEVLRMLGVSGIITEAHMHDRTRTYIKIQDGCNAWCSYCIIPHVRGRERDEDIHSIIAHAHNAAKNGFKEIVLTGIHTGRFSQLPQLIDIIGDIPGITRIRLSSIELNEVTDELVERLASGKLVPHLHIPLQSGSNEILSRMKRPYTRELFISRLEELTKKIPGIGITTDLIVGFPGETEEDFLYSLDTIEQAGIHRVHVFPYSLREGTVAANMPAHCSVTMKKNRAERAREFGYAMFARFCAQQSGMRQKVLVEEINNDDIVSGYTENYVYIQCYYPDAAINESIDVFLGEPQKGEYVCMAHKA